MANQKVRTRKISWKQLVDKHEGKERPPVVYNFGHGVTKVDTGPNKGIYEK